MNSDLVKFAFFCFVLFYCIGFLAIGIRDILFYILDGDKGEMPTFSLFIDIEQALLLRIFQKVVECAEYTFIYMYILLKLF